MSSLHITDNHDHLDLICSRHYGRQSGAVEMVLAANPDIANVAHRLPAGLKITLPDIVSVQGTKTVRLWD
jgi:phage tail protein X